MVLLCICSTKYRGPSYHLSLLIPSILISRSAFLPRALCGLGPPERRRRTPPNLPHSSSDAWRLLLTLLICSHHVLKGDNDSVSTGRNGSEANPFPIDQPGDGETSMCPSPGPLSGRRRWTETLSSEYRVFDLKEYGVRSGESLPSQILRGLSTSSIPQGWRPVARTPTSSAPSALRPGWRGGFGSVNARLLRSVR